MTNWEERINRGGDPSIVIEHVVRYGFAGAAAVRRRPVGRRRLRHRLRAEPDARRSSRSRRGRCCSRTSTSRRSRAAAGALRDARAAHARGRPQHRRRAGGARGGDRADGRRPRRDHVDGDRRAPRAPDARSSSWLCDQAARRDADVVLSVPNDAFWAMENPFHQTMWGEGAFEELRRLLPDDHVAAAQVPINGSCITSPASGGDAVDVRDATSPPRASRATSSPRSGRAATSSRPPPAPRSRDLARPAPLGAAARGRPRVPLRGSARARSATGLRRVKVCFVLNDIALSGGIGVVVEHAHQLAERHGFDVTLADDERRRRAAGPTGGCPRSSCVTLEEAQQRALRRRGRDAVEHVLPPVRRPGRALRVLRAEPRGPLLRARRAGRARPRRHHPRPAGLVHHRGALDRRHARRDPPRRAVLPRAQRRRARTSSRCPSRRRPGRHGRCASCSRATRTCGSRACAEAAAVLRELHEPHVTTFVSPSGKDGDPPWAPTA